MTRLATEYGNIIFYNQVMDKGGMRQLIGRLMTYLGSECTARVLDQLKTLGFRHATQAGISLGIDDLLTTPSKTWLIQDAEYQVHTSEEQYWRGSIHAVEKLRHVVETWHTTSEYLKREMNAHFRTTDPLNPVHMMSFSGARGSISQVHQLVGMRGLMSNPQGNIIDLPIHSNFREGLSLTEYIISCYGARKGVVDTAVRTADAGYLTRRLVEVVQHVVVRNHDCKTLEGIRLRAIQDGKGSNILLSVQDRLIGRVLARSVYFNQRCIAVRNQDIAPDLASRLTVAKDEIFVRSPLTCQSMPRACQLCYGWDLSYGSLVELGAAIGIIAGQSIGEPGTQLTLRTFHTGGVFTGDVADHVRAPFNGIIHFDTHNIQLTRNRHGRPAWTCPQAFSVILENDSGKKHILNVPQHSLLLVKNHQYVHSRQLIAEVRASIAPLKEKVEKDIYSNIQGEVYYEHTNLRPFSDKKSTLLELLSSQTRFNFWLDFTSTRSHLRSTVEKTDYIWVFSGRLNKISGDTLNVSFLYKSQDYLQTNVPIGKTNHVINQYKVIWPSLSLTKRSVLQYLIDRKKIISINTGSICIINNKNKWILMLSAGDQFNIPILDLNKKFINKNSIINQSNSFFSKFNIPNYVSCNKKENQLINNFSVNTDTQDYKSYICFKFKHGLIGSLNLLFQDKNYSYIRNLVCQIVFKNKDNYDNSVICRQKLIPIILQNKKIEDSTQYPLISQHLLFLFYNILGRFYNNRLPVNLGQSICKGAKIFGYDRGLPESGHILAVSEKHLILRLAKLYLVTKGTTVHAYHKQIINEGDTLITFVYERLKASDIIQGLPKAEQLLEARLGNEVVFNLYLRFEYLVGRIKEKLRQYVGNLTQIDLLLSQASINRAQKALEYSQIETVDQVQKVYLSQGVYISDKHVEVIVRQMSCKVMIVENTDLTAISQKGVIRTSLPYDAIGVFFPGELIEIAKARRINRVLKTPLSCKPILLGITKASLNTNSFLSEASFERTITVLSKSAIQGRTDWLKGLKENVLLSNMIPAGTGCQQVGIPIILFDNKQMHIHQHKQNFFSQELRHTFCLCKPFLKKRDWLHNQLRNPIEQSIHSKKEKILLPESIKKLLPIRKKIHYNTIERNCYF
uniref:DNA-directed RNA polymerase subunit beta'' n=2 Tax=Roya TaxID=43942 RepID=A0A024B3H3_9VIRI|nr:beta'' subunit of RNA polymerase [Roya anglica]YP_009256903.1 beta'' subunit of RNA polymerase [Roya obtusa]AHZ11124.1 beta'' subunit of RNA polymerase [Roya anglica]ANI25976.1 beta'' subunit of RNA polymerase [Roya obtusa]